MIDTSRQSVTKLGIISRAYAVVCAFLHALDYTSFDYTHDRIEKLELEVEQLKQELRQSRDPGSIQPAINN